MSAGPGCPVGSTTAATTGCRENLTNNVSAHSSLAGAVSATPSPGLADSRDAAVAHFGPATPGDTTGCRLDVLDAAQPLSDALSRLAQPGAIVDLGRIAALKGVSRPQELWTVEATLTRPAP